MEPGCTSLIRGSPKANLLLIRSYLVWYPRRPKKELGRVPRKTRKGRNLAGLAYRMGFTASTKGFEKWQFSDGE